MVNWYEVTANVAGQLVAGGLFVFLIQQFLEKRRRDAQAASDKRERASRLQVFALEAVELQERLSKPARIRLS